MDSLHPYLPTKPYFGEAKHKDLFKSYGSVFGVDVTTNHYKGKKVEIRAWRNKSCKEKYLAANQPTMPLNQPNPVNICDEPCMSEITKYNERIKHKYFQLKGYERLVKNKGMNCKMKEDLKLVKQRKAVISENIEKMSEEELNIEMEDLFFEVGNSLLTCKDLVSELTEKNVHFKKVNADYSGGCVKYVPWLETDTGLLAYSTGPNLKTISLQEVGQDKEKHLVKLKENKVTCEDTIFELQCARYNENVLCASRHADHVQLMKISKDNDQENSLPVNILKNYKSKIKLSSVALNPYIMAEYITSNENGEIVLHKSDSASVVLCQCEHRFTCHEPYFACQWGMHPREIIVTDRTGIAVYDIRTSPAKAVMDLIALPQAIFNTSERIYMSKPHPVKSYYHMLCTDYSVVLADQRFPNHPVLHWNHLINSPPMYMDMCCNVVSDSDDIFDDVLLLGSQLSCETHCFQFTTANHDRRSPVFSSVPWRVSTLSDMYSYVSCEGVVCDPFVVDRRLKSPLTGVAAIPLSQGFQVLQLTSLGDVFHQSYMKDSYIKDKTHSFGPGSQGMKVTNENQNLFSDWLKQAEELYTSNRCEGQGSDFNMYDISEQVKDLQLSDDLSHFQCSFCGSCDVLPKENYICVMCNRDIRKSKVYMDRIQQGLPVYDSSHGTNVKGDITRIEGLDDILKTVSTESHADAYSDIILCLWNDKLIDDDILKRRETEWLERNKSKDKRPNEVDFESAVNEDTDTDVQSEVDEVQSHHQTSSLFSLLGLSGLSGSSSTQDKTKTSVPMSKDSENIKVDESDEKESDNESVLSEISLLMSSHSKRHRSEEFELPLMPNQKKPKSICSEASSKLSVRSFDSSVQGFGATPPRLLQKSLRYKSNISPSVQEKDRSHGEFIMLSPPTSQSLSTSIFTHASPKALQKLNSTKKKKKSVMGF